MIIYSVTCLLALANLGDAFSKYGRTCKDIGCLDNEVCMMANDPCSYYQRENECGSYPTCKKTGDNSPPSCINYVCPPTKVCRMDGSTPKCFDDVGAAGVVPLSGQSHYPNPYNPSAPSAPSGGLYPSVPGRSQTSTRAPMYRGSGISGPGYQGGAVGSGYPGVSKSSSFTTPRPGYPSGSGYPGQTGYGNNPYGAGAGGYPGQSYPGAGVGGYPGSYPQSGRSGYPGNYPSTGYQNPYGQPTYRYNSGNSFTDKLTDQLKALGLFCLMLSFFI